MPPTWGWRMSLRFLSICYDWRKRLKKPFPSWNAKEASSLARGCIVLWLILKQPWKNRKRFRSIIFWGSRFGFEVFNFGQDMFVFLKAFLQTCFSKKSHLRHIRIQKYWFFFKGNGLYGTASNFLRGKMLKEEEWRSIEAIQIAVAWMESAPGPCK